MPDTYTSQFSGEEIDAALRAAQIISGADTPAALREKLEIRGDTIPVSATDPTPISEALTASGGGVNPNLLDNWFFGRPVNQRGQTEYPSSNGLSYTIDRWMQNSSGVKINDGYITVGGAGGMFERIENIDLLVGKLLTFSVLTTDGLYTGTTTFSKEDHVFSSADNLLVLYNQYFNAFQIAPSVAGATKNLLAAKLELGDTQTLAHKDSSGNWILNEIPDFGEQLRRCQRYARAYKCLLGQTFLPLGAYRSDRKAVSFALPTSSFRAVPTVSALNDIFQLFDGANVYGITSLAVTDYSDGLVTIYAYTSQSFEDGKVLWLFSNNGTLLLSADL